MADDTAMLAPLVYPVIWNRAGELHPRSAVDYCWKAHLRTLCAACRELIAHPEQAGIPWSVIPASERRYLEALGTVPPEMLILDIQRERQCRPDLPKWELWWADPFDGHLKPEPVAARPRPAHM
jgi:hypothetical protein